MTGSWLFIAIGALGGVMLSSGQHLYSICLLVLVGIRVVYQQDSKLIQLFIVSVILYCMIGVVKERQMATHMQAGPLELDILFIHPPEMDGDRVRSTILAEGEKVALSYKAQDIQEKQMLSQTLAAGTVCKVKGVLKQPETNRNENAFDYRLYLFRQNIHWILEPNLIEARICQEEKKSLLTELRNYRQASLERIGTAFPEELVPYAGALLFGDRSFFDEDVYNSYRHLGVVHLLAISGLHIAIIAGAFYYLLLRCGVTKETAFWILVILLPLYAVISGGNPPVIRATGMFLLLLAAKKFRLPLTTLDALSISFLFFLLYHPPVIYQVGFQLSYAVSAGIVISSHFVQKMRRHYFSQLAELSIISTVSSLPILIFHFYEFSLLSVFANLLFIPFYSIFVLPSILILYIAELAQLPFTSMLLAALAKIMLFSERISLFVGKFRYAMLVTGKPGVLAFIMISLGVLMYLLSREKGKTMLYSALPLAIFLVLHLLSITYSAKGEVIFIDVGQGDSILIKLPYNRGIYLIDTGGRLNFPQEEWRERRKTYGVGKDTLLPLLKSKGITRIDQLILTHSDTDHIGAASELLGEVQIGKILISPNSWQKPLMGRLVDKAGEQKIPVKEVKAGDGWKNQSGSFQFIYPFDDEYEGNDDSLVLFGRFGGKAWLFTGDLEKRGEEEMIRKYGRFSVDVIKVGHHGSQTSSSDPFIEALMPKYGVISAGVNNRYGHPHPDVLETMKVHGVVTFRTDMAGAVHYIFNDQEGTFHTIRPYDIENQGKQKKKLIK